MDSEALRTVRYVTEDPIQNLKIRVTLKRLSAATRGKAVRPAAADAGKNDAANAPDNAGAQAPEATQPNPQHPHQQQVVRVFGWQEKVYSQGELAAAQAALRASQQGAVAQPARAEHFGSQLHHGAEKLLVGSLGTGSRGAD